MLVYLGANANRELVRKLLEVNPAMRFLSSALFPEAPSLRDNKMFQDALVPYDRSLLSDSGEIAFTPVPGYNVLSIIDKVMSDKHLALLWTRFPRRIRNRNASEVKRYEVVYSLIKSALETCLTLQPAVVAFAYEPHMLPIYVFKKVAIELGIKTYTLTISPFPWRMNCEGSDQGSQFARQLGGDKATQTLNIDSVARFIAEKQSDYRLAKPFYEKRNLKRGLLRVFLQKLQVNGWNPVRALGSSAVLCEYKKLASARNRPRPKRYICVFLHYQPEQSTLPDGGLFVHQLLVIQMLHAAANPLGISLVIREHPATFESIFDPKWRSARFYQDIKGIGPNVHFDNIQNDPFSLIEDSLGVASVTGTVLLEAMLRGKPAIAFGHHPLLGLAAPAFIDTFSDEVSLSKMIANAIMTPPQTIKEDVERFLYRVYPMSFGADHYQGNETMSVSELRDARYGALIQVTEQLSNSALSPLERPDVSMSTK